MKQLVLLFALLIGKALFAMEPVAQNDSCIVDIEALVGKRPAANSVATDRQANFITIKHGQFLVDTAKISAAIEQLDQPTRWQRLSPRMRVAVKIILMGLASIAASCTGYLTGHDFITLLVGYITGETAARLVRDSNLSVSLLCALAIYIGSAAFWVFAMGITYYYGILSVPTTVFMVRRLFDWFSQLTGTWTQASSIYSALPRFLRDDTSAEFMVLYQKLFNVDAGVHEVSGDLSTTLASGFDLA